MRGETERLLETAWEYSTRAMISRPGSRCTCVGAAVLAEDGTIYGGCSAQQRFHASDVHAEVNAIGTMIAEGRRELSAIAVVAEMEGIAPCGACLDWILELGGEGCLVVTQCERDGSTATRRAGDMLPFHPPYTRSDDA